jgi:hypothetical protein
VFSKRRDCGGHVMLFGEHSRHVSMAIADAPLVAVRVSAGGHVCPHWWPTKVAAPGMIV